ncbi:hypothetical protein [Pelodictyon phaeoclathratiforme]|jgi:hypothetical protein|uniref:hypothetical protein n=1 Tax=Pelodictyon phaeoclathratiforme TaxID=34090 RepID=UPI00167FA399|nr:hypothetical protein [Pelodictyon phaeoclathratiforme]MBV5289765.1 hypothetical protein [Pelodictyon phaeoclathratiforme]
MKKFTEALLKECGIIHKIHNTTLPSLTKRLIDAVKTAMIAMMQHGFGSLT